MSAELKRSVPKDVPGWLYALRALPAGMRGKTRLARLLTRFATVHFRDFMALQLTPMSGITAFQDRMGMSFPAIVASGHTQVGVLRALYSQGRRVPDDCSVIGITTAQIAEWTIPRLTSVDLPLREMSVAASELLLRKVGGEAVTEQVLLPAVLVERESTAPPRVRPAHPETP